ncbi:MAG: hypothetical protein WAV95_20130 [Azonexus sp.]
MPIKTPVRNLAASAWIGWKVCFHIQRRLKIDPQRTVARIGSSHPQTEQDSRKLPFETPNPDFWLKAGNAAFSAVESYHASGNYRPFRFHTVAIQLLTGSFIAMSGHKAISSSPNQLDTIRLASCYDAMAHAKAILGTV